MRNSFLPVATPVFPLFSKTPPNSADELRDQITASLARAFDLKRGAVQIVAPDFPRIEKLAISLDGATLQAHPPRANFAAKDQRREIDVKRLTMSGNDLNLRGASADVNLSAANVKFTEATNVEGEIVLLFRKAESGQIKVDAAKSSIEALIEMVAREQAGAHGVTVESVTLDLQQQSERSIAAEVRLRARKLFIAATIRITARVDLDDGLNARLSNIRCHGEGPLGSLACGVLSPRLQQVDGAEFPLAALPLGDLRLTDVRLKVGERIGVTADFSAAA